MPCQCDSELNFRPCEHAVVCRCFVCDAMLCEACSRLVLTKSGWVRICGCVKVCSYALAVAERRTEAAS